MMSKEEMLNEIKEIVNAQGSLNEEGDMSLAIDDKGKVGVEEEINLNDADYETVKEAYEELIKSVVNK